MTPEQNHIILSFGLFGLGFLVGSIIFIIAWRREVKQNNFLFNRALELSSTVSELQEELRGLNAYVVVYEPTDFLTSRSGEKVIGVMTNLPECAKVVAKLNYTQSGSRAAYAVKTFKIWSTHLDCDYDPSNH
jgi:hypothetical protein